MITVRYHSDETFEAGRGFITRRFATDDEANIYIGESVPQTETTEIFVTDQYYDIADEIRLLDDYNAPPGWPTRQHFLSQYADEDLARAVRL